MANPGPKFTDYGLRAATGSLTKQEQKDLHNWRMKNDPDYKEKVKVDRLRKKAAAEKTKKTATKKAAEPKSNVNVLSKSPKVSNKQYNKDSNIRTKAAKAGIDMTDKAIKIRKANAAARAAGKTPVIKIRGGAGVGGMFNTKNR